MKINLNNETNTAFFFEFTLSITNYGASRYTERMIKTFLKDHVN